MKTIKLKKNKDGGKYIDAILTLPIKVFVNDEHCQSKSISQKNAMEYVENEIEYLLEENQLSEILEISKITFK